MDDWDTKGDTLRILIADDHVLLREMLRDFLASEEGIEVSVAADYTAAETMVRQGGRFDVVLLDYNMPGMQGLGALCSLHRLAPSTRVALISGSATREVAEQALEEGASAFLTKTMTPAALTRAIRAVAAGEIFPASTFLPDDPVAHHPLASQLSKRELEVLERLCQGLANKEIARELDIREPTVKLHVKTLYRKIGAANRTQAAMIAKQQGLF